MSVGMLSVSATDPGCASGIAQALAEASPGATIAVRPGVYRDDLLFSADVTLVAEDGPGTVVIDTSTGAGILVTGGVVQLRDVEVRGGHPQIPTVQVTGGTLRLDRCDVRVAGVAAVHLLDGGLRMRGTSVRNSQGAGLVIDGGEAAIVDCTVQDVAGTGVVVTGDTAPTFQGCTVKDVGGAGVLIGGTATATFDDCRLGPITGPAIVVQDEARPRFRAAAIERSQVGLYVTDHGAPILSSCRFQHVTGHGVMILEDAVPVLTDCTIEDSTGHGVHAAGRGAGTFTGCRVRRSGAASVVAVDDAHPTFAQGEVAEGREVAVLTTGRSRIVMESVALRDNSSGVSIENEAAPVLRSLRIRGGRLGVAAVGGAGRLEDSEIDAAEWAAVRIAGSSRLVLHGNRLQGGRIGVMVTGTAEAVIGGTRIDDPTEIGLVVEGDAVADVDACRISGSEGEGVRWEPGSRGALRGGEVTGSYGVGILVSSSSGVTLEKCRVRGSGAEALRLTVPADTVTTKDLDLGDLPKPPVPDVRTQVRTEVSTGDGGSGPLRPMADVGDRFARAQPAAAPEASEEAREPAATPEPPREPEPVRTATPARTQPPAPARAAGPEPDADQVKALLDQVKALAGLDAVKREITTLVGLHRLARRQSRAGIQALPAPRHLVLAGPPGTGKATVAGLYAQILAALGVLGDGRLVVARRADLVTQPWDEPEDGTGPEDRPDRTAAKTAAKIEKALGGVLFLPEAHTLAEGPTARVVIDTLTEQMDRHRDDLVVVAAGPVAGMQALLAAGLASRFNRTIEFADFSSADLVAVVEQLCVGHHYVLDPETRDELARFFDAQPRTERFENARVARRVFEDMLGRQAYRLAENPDVDEAELARLRPADLPGRDG